jgi:acetoin utilization deacetylase AcuC-like enzyme
MGFCLLNNVAIAARYAIDEFGLQRVAIVDYDVHHGNGTQDIFYEDGRVLFCSTHAAMIFPGSGALNEQGRGGGLGTTLNLPLPHGVGDRGYPRLFDEVVRPALRRYRPQLILVSAGFDAHWSDPLGTEILSAQGYARLTRTLYDAAAELCDGQLVLVLEGGYNLDALGACVVAACEVLLGRTPRPDAVGAIGAREPDIEPLIVALRRSHPLLQGEQ